GVVRTIYVDVSASLPAEALASVTMILNERLAGLRLTEIRSSLPERLRDAATDDAHSTELINIFLQSAEALGLGELANDELMLGRTSVLANQPEFAEGPRLRSLIELTEQRELLRRVLSSRPLDASPAITIGAEHDHPQLSGFTLVTSEYRLGNLAGVLGVMGPTRMPYEKVAAIVAYTSLMMTELSSPTPTRGGEQENH
ncbi:MAG: hypothetical protein ACRELX_13340, partial [Longimicrobiales bacterium]